MLLSRLNTARRLLHLPSCKSSLITTSTKALSTRTDFSHRTKDNVIKGNSILEYPVEDCFTFFSKRIETFGDALAMVCLLLKNLFFIRITRCLLHLESSFLNPLKFEPIPGWPLVIFLTFNESFCHSHLTMALSEI